jgi:iron complex outermembrane receptor protein
VRANVAGFYYDISDQQIGKVVNLQATLTNAASSTIYGADFEFIALVTDQFELSANLGWLETEFDEFVTEDPGGVFVAPGVLPTVDLSGNELPRSPNFTADVSGTYTWPMGDWGNLALRATWQHQGSQFFTQFNRDSVRQGSYDLFHGRLTFTAPDERWSVGLFVNNAGDKTYLSNILESGVVQGIGLTVPQGFIGAPRTFGVTASFNYD